MKVKEGRRRYPRKGGRDIGQSKNAKYSYKQLIQTLGNPNTRAQASVHKKPMICYNKSD